MKFNVLQCAMAALGECYVIIRTIRKGNVKHFLLMCLLSCDVIVATLRRQTSGLHANDFACKLSFSSSLYKYIGVISLLKSMKGIVLSV